MVATDGGSHHDRRGNDTPCRARSVPAGTQLDAQILHREHALVHLGFAADGKSTGLAASPMPGDAGGKVRRRLDARRVRSGRRRQSRLPVVMRRNARAQGLPAPGLCGLNAAPGL